MYKIPSNEFGLQIKTNTSRPPGAGSIGTSVVPGNNTYGSYVQLAAGSILTDDVYGIRIMFNNGTVNGAARDIIATIGLDAAGGTTYTDTINHLLCSAAALYYYGGYSYYFPLFIKKGTSIGCKASVNNATVGTVRCFAQLFCQPRRIDAVQVGAFVQTFGATTASSSGTGITTGTTSEGAWTQLGTLDKTLWHWEFGLGANTNNMDSAVYHCDLGLGDGTNMKIPIVDGIVMTDGTEYLAKPVSNMPGIGVSGDGVYGRTQYGSTGNNVISMCAYGIGGGVF